MLELKWAVHLVYSPCSSNLLANRSSDMLVQLQGHDRLWFVPLAWDFFCFLLFWPQNCWMGLSSFHHIFLTKKHLILKFAHFISLFKSLNPRCHDCNLASHSLLNWYLEAFVASSLRPYCRPPEPWPMVLFLQDQSHIYRRCIN